MEEHVGRVAKGDKEVEAAVVVEIDPTDLAGFAFDIDAEVSRDIGELSVAIVAVELVGRA